MGDTVDGSEVSRTAALFMARVRKLWCVPAGVDDDLDYLRSRDRPTTVRELIDSHRRWHQAFVRFGEAQPEDPSPAECPGLLRIWEAGERALAQGKSLSPAAGGAEKADKQDIGQEGRRTKTKGKSLPSAARGAQKAGGTRTHQYSKSRFRGVSGKYGKWFAEICIRSKITHLGTFDAEDEVRAAKTYDAALYLLRRPKDCISDMNFQSVDPDVLAEVKTMLDEKGIDYSEEHKTGRGGTRGSSRFKGVSRERRYGSWRASLSVDGELMHLGSYSSETEAAKAVDEAAVKKGLRAVNKQLMAQQSLCDSEDSVTISD